MAEKPKRQGWKQLSRPRVHLEGIFDVEERKSESWSHNEHINDLGQ